MGTVYLLTACAVLTPSSGDRGQNVVYSSVVNTVPYSPERNTRYQEFSEWFSLMSVIEPLLWQNLRKQKVSTVSAMRIAWASSTRRGPYTPGHCGTPYPQCHTAPSEQRVVRSLWSKGSSSGSLCPPKTRAFAACMCRGGNEAEGGLA